ncbi:spore germination protein [Paenibacillus polymyxa]|uniref:spore germination protein n=1 Tax=Paenibacillus polymyxa TaxID=1406 RepID=UPI0032175FB4
MKFPKFSKKLSHSNSQQNTTSHQKELLHTDLDVNIERIKKISGSSSDINIRVLRIGELKVKMGIIYTDGLVDKKVITDFTTESLRLDIVEMDIEQNNFGNQNVFDVIKDYAATVGDIKEVSDFDALFNTILSGDTIILLAGFSNGISINSKGWKERGVTEPSSQSVVRGPKEGFSESLGTNTALIRRKIKDPNLWLETFQIGRVTKTDVVIMYIHGIAKEKIVKEVRERINRIDIDGILESGYIEELIQDKTFTPFPTVHNTERPDAAAAGLLEGRVAILVDGTPFVLLVPALFSQFLQASEDYYQRWDFATLLRLIRYLSVFISLLAPSLYIAATTFHQELIPTPLLLSLAANREGVPFPAFVEALLMEITFEILREAGVRMPRAIGQAVSIVGTLVIGQAAVEAGIVSPAMVIVVSITAISNFVMPAFNIGISIRILRFALMGLAASLGLYGITLGLIVIVLHLCSLRSFGVPYMSPMAPFNSSEQKDTIFRFPHWALFSRPKLISKKNDIREDNEAPQPEPQQNA